MTLDLTQFTESSRATVATARPARYAKQLTSHMGQKITTLWDETALTGRLLFDRSGTTTGYVDLECTDTTLILTLHALPSTLENLEGVTGRHLARFGRREEMVVSWVRADGTPGTTQSAPHDEPQP